MRGLRAALMGAERGGAAASARLAGTELMPSTGRAALQCMRTQWCGAVEIRADRAVGGWFAERLAELVKAIAWRRTRWFQYGYISSENGRRARREPVRYWADGGPGRQKPPAKHQRDRKSTRLNSS